MAWNDGTLILGLESELCKQYTEVGVQETKRFWFDKGTTYFSYFYNSIEVFLSLDLFGAF